jgi:hypothetical protein
MSPEGSNASRQCVRRAIVFTLSVDGVDVGLSSAAFWASIRGSSSFSNIVGLRGFVESTAQASADACPRGYYCLADVVPPQTCPASTYNNRTGASNASAACLPCVAGRYCPAASAEGYLCAPGTYNPTPGRGDASACLWCPVGFYCPSAGTLAAVACPPGTFNNLTGAYAPDDCRACALGGYSLASALTKDCALCPPNYYCPSATVANPCPANTASAGGSGTLLRCLCVGGFTCAYTKRIVATITLGNTTVTAFNANTGGVRAAFLRAVAFAAGVPEARVAIQNVVVASSARQGRRLLLHHHHDDALDEAAEMIEVTAFVHGAERLHELAAHLARHGHAHRHRGHAWREAHTLAVARRSNY